MARSEETRKDATSREETTKEETSQEKTRPDKVREEETGQEEAEATLHDPASFRKVFRAYLAQDNFTPSQLASCM